MKNPIKMMRTITLALFVFIASNVVAQSNFIYGKQFGSEKDAVAYNPVTDKDGNVYIAGDTKCALDGQFFGNIDGFVSKYDSTGNAIWTKQFGTSEDDRINWLTLDQAGNIYVTGYTKGLVNEKNFGKEDIIVAKFDANGNVVWQRQFGSDSTDIGNTIYVNKKGDIYVVGATKGTVNKMSFGGVDAVILKLDSKGDIAWQKQIGTAKGDEIQGITGDSEFNIYVCGYTQGDLGGKNLGRIDAFIAKYTDNGEQIKLFQFGTAGFDMASHIALDKDQNIYIGGSTGGELGGKAQGEGDSYLSKLSKNFEIIWTKQFGTEKWDGVNGIALNEQISGNIVVSGCQHWPACQSFIRMYSKDGNLIWANNYVASTKNGGTCGKGVCIDNKGNIYHSGNTGGNLFKSIDKAEGHDIFLIKLNMDKSQMNK